jgi:hypothetical protein
MAWDPCRNQTDDRKAAMSLILDNSQLELLAGLVSEEAERLDYEAQAMENRKSQTRFYKTHAEGMRARAAHARTTLAELKREIDARHKQEGNV